VVTLQAKSEENKNRFLLDLEKLGGMYIQLQQNHGVTEHSKESFFCIAPFCT